ncbi:ABC transporter permease [Rhizomonospora bruguierae]|uniref:ABC transporter permease n=1 Tax=Rhizomonospora bruguierae TaxID=1581705 RepID=UPI001BCE700E|nr:ABC transporter permease [Micromonospora sp. NBRC 107566]
MSALTGTRHLTRLAFRLDRLRLPVWVLAIALLPMATAAQYKQLYPTKADLDSVRAVLSTPALVAIGGPLFRVSLGGLTAWKIMSTELILIGLMSLLTVVRHTRTEEETGRLELISAGVVGRHAPLTAALVTAGLADLVAGALAALFLLATGLPATGSLALGLAVCVTGLAFAAIAAVAVQLTENARTAIAIAGAVLAGSYLLRAVGDTGPTWLSWLSPLGWAIHIRAYAGERWWVAGLAVALAALLAALAYTLAGRRDVGAALLAQRPGPAMAAAGLRSPFGLAWRLHRGLLAGWLFGMAVAGAALGGAASALTDQIAVNQELTDMLARLGGSKGVTDGYLGAVFGIVGLVVACYTVQATLRLRAEESAGRLEPLLATRTGRVRWALSHLVFAVVGSALLLAAAGAAGGLAYGAQISDVGGQVPRLLGAAMVQLPAAWVLAGLGVALFGLVPQATPLTWVALVACLVLLELGALLNLSRWIVDASPFAHVPKLPGAEFSATPVLWLTAVAVVLAAAGLVGFRRRDIG